MFEVKVAISTPELANAINNLAAAIGSKIPQNTAVSSTSSTAPIQTPTVNQAPPVNQAENFTRAQQTPPPANVTGVPLSQAPQYTVDQIMAAGSALMDAGRGTELINLLHSFGVQAVMDLKPEQIGAFATALRNMGAKI